MQEVPRFGVSGFVEVINQTLEYAYPTVEVEGEVAEFKISQGKWVSFKLKDAEVSVEAFLFRSKLGVELQDGMKVIVRAAPRLTKWGRFSLNVQAIKLVGEGDIRRNFLLLARKLEAEGLFSETRKRGLPEKIERIAVISSVEAAGYKDFVKILNERWGGLVVKVAHTQVQGISAPEQMIRALSYLNVRSRAQVIVMVRGGGSREDLAAFDDERLVRAIAASKIPVLTGVGHEIDTTLADLAADVRASTPSNAAEWVTRDKREVVRGMGRDLEGLRRKITEGVEREKEVIREEVIRVGEEYRRKVEGVEGEVKKLEKMLSGMNPEEVLRRGYAIIRGNVDIGNVVKITTHKKIANMEVKSVEERK